MVVGRIFQGNLDLFLTALSWLSCASFEAEDWEVVAEGLMESGGECSHVFSGGHTIRFEATADPDSDDMQVRVEAPAELRPQVELLIAIFQNFKLRKRQTSR